MKDKADPLLLSLLEKIANPLTDLDFTVTVKGVFAPSEQWYLLKYQGNNQTKLIQTSSLIL